MKNGIKLVLKYLLLSTGSEPGSAASKCATAVFGGEDRAEDVDVFDGAPENSFDFESICACTSSPTTLSHFSPVRWLSLYLWRRGPTEPLVEEDDCLEGSVATSTTLVLVARQRLC